MFALDVASANKTTYIWVLAHRFIACSGADMTKAITESKALVFVSPEQCTQA
jgi:hypothetical protein